MLRLVHNQTVTGGILVDDIDDGLPNKEVHRFGSNADPKAYTRDGYANKPKQACYIPTTQVLKGFPTVKGYITLNQTPRVTLSAGKGKIKKLQTAGLISVVSLTAINIAPVTVSAGHIAGGNLTITGTTLTSVSPDTTTVVITGTGAVTLTQAQILAVGTIAGTSIVIPTASLPGVANGTSSVQVIANEKSSAVVAIA